MNTKNFTILIFFSVFLFSCKPPTYINKNIKFPFGLCQYNGGLLISNLGGDSVDFFGKNQDGFISYYKNGKCKKLINNGLCSPKGMAVKDSFLFVADVNSIVVFNLNNPESEIDRIEFKQGNALVNSLLIMGGTLFISVSNHNLLYLLNIEKPGNIDHSSLIEYLSVPNPSSLKSTGYYLFVASSSNFGSSEDENIIHIIDNLSNPGTRPIFHEEGNYQGLELSSDKTQLIFSNQNNPDSLGFLVFENGSYNYHKKSETGAVFFDILRFEANLYLTDLYGDKILIINDI